MTVTAMASVRSRILPVWEQYYPLLFAITSAIVWILVGYRFACYAETNNWHFDQIYTAFFGFASITTGFLATFYGTVQSTSIGFIQRIRGTRALSGFLRLTKRAIVMGFVGCLVTVPMLVIQPVPMEQYSVKTFVVALWLGVAVWALSGFWRVASSLFLLFESNEGSRPAG